MNLTEIDWSNLPAITVMGLVVIIVAWVTWQQAKVNAMVVATALDAGAQATKEAVTALKDSQAQSREFYMNKLGDTLSSLRLLEGRVQDLENQIEERDRRISELERENEQLHSEIDALRRKLNDKNNRAEQSKPSTAMKRRKKV